MKRNKYKINFKELLKEKKYKKYFASEVSIHKINSVINSNILLFVDCLQPLLGPDTPELLNDILKLKAMNDKYIDDIYNPFINLNKKYKIYEDYIIHNNEDNRIIQYILKEKDNRTKELNNFKNYIRDTYLYLDYVKYEYVLKKDTSKVITRKDTLKIA